MQLIEKIKTLIRNVPDFSLPGIIFKDISPLPENPETVKKVVDEACRHFKTTGVDAVAAMESKDFFIVNLSLSAEL